MSYLFTGSSRFYRPERSGASEAGAGSLTEPLPGEEPAVAPVSLPGEGGAPKPDGGVRSPELSNDVDFVTLEALQKKASDILVSCDNLFYRIDGRVMPQGPAPGLVGSILKLRPDLGLRLADTTGSGAEDFAIEIHGRRLRVNVFRARGGLNAALRPVPVEVPPAEALGLEERLLDRVLQAKQGLILVTGPTGSGKSTTVNCLVDWINQNRACHILSVEDPIEFVYTPKMAAIEQREVGTDVNSFDEAIRSAMRENPDVIVVGEIRDYATLKAGLQAAETGHLVFGTMHTRRVASTISRAITMAPGSEREDVRGALVNSLLLVICQLLLPRVNEGRVACREIMVANAATLNLIREKNETGIPSELSLNRKALGTLEYNQALKLLLAEGSISQATHDEYRDTQKSMIHA
ncbi:MAG: Flp pilus assembly complex ATPase component TadA [Verrucomicrobia bacterium]|nr:Flp pilus assembly complex ATPase component TadA [Verrucomicrobiota bacterium]